MIWEYVLGGRTWRIAEDKFSAEQLGAAAGLGTGTMGRVRNPDPQALALIKVCKLIHKEAKDLPVQLSTFCGGMVNASLLLGQQTHKVTTFVATAEGISHWTGFRMFSFGPALTNSLVHLFPGLTRLHICMRYARLRASQTTFPDRLDRALTAKVDFSLQHMRALFPSADITLEATGWYPPTNVYFFRH